MEKKNDLKPDGRRAQTFHYAWIIAFCGLLITGGSVGIFFSCIGVFIKPVCDDLGFLRGQFTVGNSIVTLICVALMPTFGSLFRRFGFRRIALFGAIAGPLTLFGYSISTNLWQFYAFSILSGLFSNGIGMMAVGVLISKWFVDKRGLATGIAYSGSGLIAALLIPATNRFIVLYGWQWAYRFLGIVSLCLLLPVILFVVRDSPEEVGLMPYCAGHEDGARKSQDIPLDLGVTRSEALREKAFWFLSAAVMGITICQAGPHLQLVSFLTDIGHPSEFASSVSAVYMVCMTVCKVGMGFVFDRLGSLRASLLIGGCCVLFPTFALFAFLPVVPWVYAILLAIASAGATILGTALTANYFGRKDFSGVYSLVSMFSFIGVAVSAPLLGTIYDKTGNYTLAWILLLGIGIAVCACLICANRFSKEIRFHGQDEEVTCRKCI